MFDHAKVVKKLKKLDELSGKKVKKVLDTILISDDFREWLFGGKDGRSQPINGPMLSEIIDNLAKPNNLKALKKYIKSKPYDDGFDRTSAYIIMLVIHSSIDMINRESESINIQYKAGEIDSKTVKGYKERIDAYTEIVDDVMAVLKEKIYNVYGIKKIANATNLPKELVYSTFISVPDMKYEPIYKLSGHLNNVLAEIYSWTGTNGLQDKTSLNWKSYFDGIFSSDVSASVAISILLEGTRKIDTYSEHEHFDDVKCIWDGLSLYALTELNNAPENVRRHMIDIYLKKAGNIFRNNKGHLRLRVDLMNLPSRFDQLIKTVNSYSDSFVKLFGGDENAATVTSSRKIDAPQVKDFRSFGNTPSNVDDAEDSEVDKKSIFDDDDDDECDKD